MTFEIGKFYQHTTGIKMKILCRAVTQVYGDCLLAEVSNSTDFQAVGEDEAAAENWHEIPAEEWVEKDNYF